MLGIGSCEYNYTPLVSKATTMATRTGLLLTKTVRGNARSLGKVDGNKLLSVVLEGLKNSKNSWYSSANKHTNRRSVSIESLFSKMLVKKAPRFRNGILNCGEFFRPSRTTDNNLLPSTFPSDRALPRTVLVSNKPVLVAIVVALLTRGV